MDFEVVCDFFGGSIFPEEPRCNYTDVLARIEVLDGTGDCANIETRAATNLFRAIFAIVTGRHMTAKKALDDLIQVYLRGDLPQRWAFRLRSYILLNTIYTLFPPLLRSSPVIKGASPLLVENFAFSRQGPDAAITLQLQENEGRRPDTNSLDCLEFDTFVCIYLSSMAISNVIASLKNSNCVSTPHQYAPYIVLL